MLPLYNLQSAVGLYQYTHWVQNYVHCLYPHLAPQARTPDVLLALCECACSARSQSAADIHGVARADLQQARDFFFAIAAQELVALQHMN